MGLPRPERLATHLHSTAAVLRPTPLSPLPLSLLPPVSCQELPSNWALSCLALKRCDNFLSNLKVKFLATWPALAAARVTCKWRCYCPLPLSLPLLLLQMQMQLQMHNSQLARLAFQFLLFKLSEEHEEGKRGSSKAAGINEGIKLKCAPAGALKQRERGGESVRVCVCIYVTVALEQATAAAFLDAAWPLSRANKCQLKFSWASSSFIACCSFFFASFLTPTAENFGDTVHSFGINFICLPTPADTQNTLCAGEKGRKRGKETGASLFPDEAINICITWALKNVGRLMQLIGLRWLSPEI